MIWTIHGVCPYGTGSEKIKKGKKRRKKPTLTVVNIKTNS